MDMEDNHESHESHDHSAHGGMDMSGGGHDHGAIGRNPDGSYYYTHGAFLGHIVPGSFFIIWGVYWLLATFHAYLQASALRRQFSPRSWYLCPWGTAWLRAFPLEPVIKIVLPSIGILGEVWLGHPSWRTLIGPDGKFVVDNINDWQHSAMYSCFVASGITDLLGHFSHLPAGIDRAFLGLAFLCQGVLLVFHLKGPQIEILVHLILVLQIFATVIATFMEGIWLDSLPTAAARPILTILQGVWWVQTAFIMYVADPAFDPEEMGGAMMTPVIMVIHFLWISFGSLLVFVFMRSVQSRILGREIGFSSLKNIGRVDEESQALRDDMYRNVDAINARVVELSGSTRHVQ